MKTKCLLFMIALLACFSLCACSRTEAAEEQKKTLESEITELKAEKAELEALTINLKEEKGIAKYVITFKIKQSHFTLDIGEHLKDEMNTISIQIPVDKEYYDSVEIGDMIDDSFRMGSLIMHGSFGSWDVTVENKEIQ